MYALRKYGLAYKVIPELVALFNQGKIPMEALLDKAWQVSIHSECTLGFSWDEYKIEHGFLSAAEILIIYTFPEPEYMPEAKFGLVFVDTKSSIARYYTLEKPYKENCPWVIGAQVMGHPKPHLLYPQCKIRASSGDIFNGDTHLNFGNLIEVPTIGNFISYVLDNFENDTPKETPAPKRWYHKLFRK